MKFPTEPLAENIGPMIAWLQPTLTRAFLPCITIRSTFMFFELLSVWRLNLAIPEKECRFLPSNVCDQLCPTTEILYRFWICPFFSSGTPHHPKRSLSFLRYICIFVKYVCVYVLVCVYICHMFVGNLRGQRMISAPWTGNCKSSLENQT